MISLVDIHFLGSLFFLMFFIYLYFIDAFPALNQRLNQRLIYTTSAKLHRLVFDLFRPSDLLWLNY